MKRSSYTHNSISVQKGEFFKVREVFSPDELTREKHRSMLKTMYSGYPVSPHATAGVPGMTLLDNVFPHIDSNDFYMLDIHDAFTSVDIEVLLQQIADSDAEEYAKEDLLNFVMDWAIAEGYPGLPQGAPASPYLFNIYCQPLDAALHDYCDERDIAYTRYLDDFTFSRQEVLGAKTRKALRDMITDHPGMEINHRKTRHHSLKTAPVTVTGVSLYSDGHIAASPKIIDSAREVCDRAEATLRDTGALDIHVVAQIEGYAGVLGHLSDDRSTAVNTLLAKVAFLKGFRPS